MSEKPIELGDKLFVLVVHMAKDPEFLPRLLADPAAVVGEAALGFPLTPDELRAALGLSDEDSTPVVEALKERLSKMGFVGGGGTFGGAGAGGSW